MKKLALNTDYIKNGEFWRYGSWNDSTHFRGIESKQGYFLCSSWEELWGLLYYVDGKNNTTYYNEIEDDYINSQDDRFDGLEYDEIIELYTENDYQELCENYLRDDQFHRDAFFVIDESEYKLAKRCIANGSLSDLGEFINKHPERESDILEWAIIDGCNYVNYLFDSEACKDDLAIWED